MGPLSLAHVFLPLPDLGDCCCLTLTLLPITLPRDRLQVELKACRRQMGRKGGGKGGRKSAGALSSEDEGDRWSEADSEASFLSADVAAHGGGEEADGGEEAGGGVSFLEAVEMLSEKR